MIHSLNMRLTFIAFVLSMAIPWPAWAGVEPSPPTSEARWRRKPSPTCTAASTTVTLASADIAHAAGFEFVQVQSQPLGRIVERNVELAYNTSKYARMSSRSPGVVAEVLKDLGDTVQKGEVLAIVESSELGSAKSDLLMAMETANLWEANAKRERSLVQEGIGAERKALEAETEAAESRIAVNKARQRLRTLGLSPAQIEVVEKEADTSPQLAIHSPFNGEVVERNAVIGEVIDSTTPLLAVADISVMWAMVDLQASDLSHVKRGQSAVVTIDGLLDESFAGTLTWISTQLDHKTRTVKARIELSNESTLLRANMFGQARISAGDQQSALMIPQSAVQWEGCCNVAFVSADASGMTFQPVRLALASRSGNLYEVREGLKAGDTVVTNGSFILKNEILKDSVGAGCCEVGHLDK